MTVADVSGKGVSASLLMASLRAALHSEIRPKGRIDAMAAKLNDFVQKSSAINAFITFFYGELDTESGTFSFVNAGHNHPFILDKGGTARFLETTGLCLGMLPDMEYGQLSDALAPGETLVLFTDGIIESRDKSEEEYGTDRLVDICRKSAGAAATEIMNAVFRDLDAFTSKAPAADDRTLVVVKREC